MTKVKRRKLSNNLIQSVMEGKWCEVYRYLHEADQPDSTNTYALHAVSGDRTAPLKIVTDIYNAYPKAALAKNANNETPISIAVDAGFEHAVHFLANTCPEACEHCNALQSAIYESGSSHMIDSIIVANPKAAFVRDNDGDSAFDLFFRQFNVSVRIAVSNQIECNKFNYSTEHGDWDVEDIHQKACLFLKAANLYRKGIPLDDNCVLHRAFEEQSCYWAFCKLLMILCPDQILKRDSDGNLPLHIIVAHGDKSDKQTFLCLDCFTNKSKLMHVEYLNGEPEYCCKDCLQRESKALIKHVSEITPVFKVHEIVKELMDIAPQTVLIQDSKGNYPLHLAIQNQQSFDIVYRLFKASTCTGKILDVETNLLPFMLAAKDNWKDKRDQINITYQLLREDPLLIFGF